MRKISAKWLREMLNVVKVVNDHEFSKVVQPVPPMVSYAKADRYWSARWYVWRAGYKVDPNAHWHDNGAKVFQVGKVNGVSDKNDQFTAAVAWASEKYTHWSDEWVKTPFGAWMPQDALEQALRHHLPELFKEKKPTADPVVQRIVEKMYGDDPEMAESEPTVETDGWYRVVGAGVAVFTYATSEQDARNRVEHMIQRVTMDVDTNLHITKRDPEVY